MDLDPQALKAGAGLLIIWGILDCFFGYRVFRFTVVLLGAAAGAILGHQLFVDLLGIVGSARWIGFGLGLVLGGILSFGLYLAGVFLLGFTLGFSLVPGFWPDGDKGTLLLVGAVAGVVCGIIATIAQRPLIAAGTAWTGAIRVVLGIAFFAEGLDWSQYAAHPERVGVLFGEHFWMLVAFIILGAAGFIAQLMGHRSAKTSSEKK